LKTRQCRVNSNLLKYGSKGQIRTADPSIMRGRLGSEAFDFNNLGGRPQQFPHHTALKLIELHTNTNHIVCEFSQVYQQ
ncbi:MAG: hypothetical protein JAY74_17625, partial [Candidatus Thiodiazotropha taylori]|nr:hypothetical protein [Candidatus Thiodiazotropha taylori]